MSDSNLHAILSPSSADRWMACPGSVLMEQGLPDVESDYAKEGTAAHEYAAIWLETGLPPILPWKAQNGFEFSNTDSEEEMDAIRDYVDHVKKLAAGHYLLIEQKLPIGHITLEDGAEGTGDNVVIESDGETLAIGDLKFGMGVKVYARKNKQMMLYALGALHRFAAMGNFTKFKLRIFQPRLEHFDEWECTLAELEAFADEVNFRAQFIWRLVRGEVKFIPEQDLVPGEKQDRFCKAKATCPKAINNALTVAAGDFTDISTNPATKLSTALQRVEHLDNTKLSLMLQNVDMLEAIIKAVRAKGLSELSAGRDVPGFKLVQGKKGNRKWQDEKLVEKTLKDWRLKQSDIYNMKVISPADAEKLFKDNQKHWAVIKEMYSQSSGAPSVAPSTDPRPVLEAGARLDDFDVIEP